MEISLEPNENLIDLTITLSVADADEFTAWCEDQGLTLAQGLNNLLVLANRTRSAGTLSDDRFNEAFAAARGKVSPDIILN